MNVSIRIVQDEDGKDILPTSRLDFEDLSGFPEAMRNRELSLRNWKAMADVALGASPELVPLFQNGAMLSVKDHFDNSILMQIAGIQGNLKKRDNRRCWGTIGSNSAEMGLYSYCSFDVRLFRTGVHG